MIQGALKLIRYELDTWLDSNSATDQVVLMNISQWDPASSDNSILEMKNKVVMTLVNIAEEAAMKNQPGSSPYSPSGQSGPSVPLNLFVLFVFNRDASQYDQALRQLGKVIRFFREKPVFTQVNTPPPPNTIDPNEPFKMIFEMVNLDFEAQNHLWGMLGGKQMPSVMYKIRLIEIKPGQQAPPVPPVGQVQIQS
ncbi:MAG: DUF4255 domain-containing protein [Bacteroidia bacterium]|nr:DUF4255 domain-containing protein [Bacteroidia bacterium]